MPKTTLSFYLHIIAVAVIVFALGHFFYAHPEERAAASVSKDSTQKESVYDRVMRTGTIRCGYLTYSDWLAKDPQTGKLNGMFVEVMDEVSRLTNLKIEWVEEVGWGNMLAGLESNRYDLVCMPVWESLERLQGADFSDAVFYNLIYAWVRDGDNRFLDVAALRKAENIKVSAIDGDAAGQIAKEDFPNASLLSLPQLAGIPEMLANVANNKADVTFQAPFAAAEFNQASNIKLKRLGAEPVRFFKTAFPMKKNEDEFRKFLNGAIWQITANGKLEQILQKYEKYPGSFYRVAKPYQLPTN